MKLEFKPHLLLGFLVFIILLASIASVTNNGGKMEKLVYARDGKEFSRAVLGKQRITFEVDRADPEPPPSPTKNTDQHQHHH